MNTYLIEFYKNKKKKILVTVILQTEETNIEKILDVFEMLWSRSRNQIEKIMRVDTVTEVYSNERM